MDKPVKPDDHLFHEHSCTECNETMRHWNKTGCQFPYAMKCDTCKAPKPKPKEADGVLVADAIGELDAALEDVGTNC